MSLLDSIFKRYDTDIGRKFFIFVKPYDDEGLIDELKCGWYMSEEKNGRQTTLRLKDAKTFVNKSDGHGSVTDWLEMLSSEHPDWKLSYRFIDEMEISDEYK